MQWPPTPSVEDEHISLAREWPVPVLHDDTIPNLGSIDQSPTIMVCNHGSMSSITEFIRPFKESSVSPGLVPHEVELPDLQASENQAQFKTPRIEQDFTGRTTTQIYSSKSTTHPNDNMHASRRPSLSRVHTNVIDQPARCFHPVGGRRASAPCVPRLADDAYSMKPARQDSSALGCISMQPLLTTRRSYSIVEGVSRDTPHYHGPSSVLNRSEQPMHAEECAKVSSRSRVTHKKRSISIEDSSFNGTSDRSTRSRSLRLTSPQKYDCGRRRSKNRIGQERRDEFRDRTMRSRSRARSSSQHISRERIMSYHVDDRYVPSTRSCTRHDDIPESRLRAGSSSSSSTSPRSRTKMTSKNSKCSLTRLTKYSIPVSHRDAQSVEVLHSSRAKNESINETTPYIERRGQARRGSDTSTSGPRYDMEILSLGHQPCTAGDLRTQTWWRVHDHRKGRAVPNLYACSSCAQEAQNSFPSFRGILRLDDIPEEHSCSLRIGSGQYREIMTKLATADKRYQHGDDKYLDDFWLSQSCRHSGLVPNELWHIHAEIPDLTVCATCYKNIVYPRRTRPIARDISIGLKKVPNSTIRPGTASKPPVIQPYSCQLSSERMQQLFCKATKGIVSFDRFREAVSERAEHQRRLDDLERCYVREQQALMNRAHEIEVKQATWRSRYE